MNMVVGANGTGKSSILSAICLGLGGAPKLLGRADDLRAFVQNGQDVATIRIQLAPGTHTITRTIDVNKGSARGKGRGASSFWINDASASLEQVQQLVKGEYRIHIDNLCTFLPQEQVGSFSGLTSAQRLWEAEKTLPDDLYGKHQEIIQMQQDLENHQSDLHLLETTLQKKQAELDRLEIDKGREEERLQAAEQLDLLTAKRLWLEFDEVREQVTKLKEVKKELTAKLKEARRALQPLQEKHADLASRHKKSGLHLAKADDKLKSEENAMADQQKKYVTHDDHIMSTFANLQEIDSERELTIQKHKEQAEKLKKMEETVASESIDELKRRFDEAKQHTRTTTREQQESKRELTRLQQTIEQTEDDAKRLKTKLDRLNDEESRRREAVFRADPSLKKIYEYIENNRDRFQKRVYGPVVVEVSPLSTVAAAQLEQHVSNSVWKAFVCESKQDREMLYKEIRGQLKVGVNLLDIENIRLQSNRMYRDEDYQKLKRDYGIEGYLDECFEAPEPIRIALEKFASPHRVLVGNHDTLEAIDKHGLKEHLTKLVNGGSCVIASNSQGNSFKFTQIVSAYSKNMSSREDQIGAARLLAPGVEDSEKEILQNQLDEKNAAIENMRPRQKELGSKVTDLESKAQEQVLQMQAAKSQYEAFVKMKSKVDRQREKVDELAKAIEVDKTPEKKRSALRDLMKRFSSMVSATRANGDHYDSWMEAHSKKVALTVQQSLLSNQERLARYVFQRVVLALCLSWTSYNMLLGFQQRGTS